MSVNSVLEEHCFIGLRIFPKLGFFADFLYIMIREQQGCDGWGAHHLVLREPSRCTIYPHMYLFILRELHGEVLKEGVLEQLLAGPALARILHVHQRLKEHSIKYPQVEKSLGLRICLQNSMK